MSWKIWILVINVHHKLQSNDRCHQSSNCPVSWLMYTANDAAKLQCSISLSAFSVDCFQAAALFPGTSPPGRDYVQREHEALTAQDAVWQVSQCPCGDQPWGSHYFNLSVAYGVVAQTVSALTDWKSVSLRAANSLLLLKLLKWSDIPHSDCISLCIFAFYEPNVCSIKLFCTYQTRLVCFTLNIRHFSSVVVWLDLFTAPDVLDHVYWTRRAVLNNDHSRPRTTSTQESQRWGRKDDQKGRRWTSHKLFLLWRKWRVPDICEITEKRNSQVWLFIKKYRWKPISAERGTFHFKILFSALYTLMDFNCRCQNCQ